ncbi:hypothetical protein DENSPDRAFT_418541 [Dentipellis sp. KUC8613]|nr:hypothetical protein DENSPDRAFT_418541 [Dentipellis sp. KUC8613]
MSGPLIFPYYAEFERDAQGNYIPDPEFGYKLTAESMENHRQWRALYFKGNEPMITLPSHFRVSARRPANTLPTLHFGFPLQFDQAFEYAKRRKLKLLGENADPDLRPSFAAIKTIMDLDRRTGADLRYEIPRIEGYDFMISLYTNLTLEADQLEKEEEKEVADIIQRELQISDPPMWYWDVATTHDER